MYPDRIFSGVGLDLSDLLVQMRLNGSPRKNTGSSKIEKSSQTHAKYPGDHRLYRK